MDRRAFLQAMAASLALAGTGCRGRPPHGIISRVEGTAAVEVEWFATVMPSEGYGRGIVVRTNHGHPTKVEGNPDHPESLGATDVFAQAAILSLHDPVRSRTPRHAGNPATWEQFAEAWEIRRTRFRTNSTPILAILAEPTTSPTWLRQIHALLDDFPSARWYQHAPLGSHSHRGHLPEFDLAQAEVILTVESDLLYRHPAALRHGRALAGRRLSEPGKPLPPRFYAIEAVPSVTGAVADFRLPMAPARLSAILPAVDRCLRDPAAAPGLEPAADGFVRDLADAMRRARGRVVVSAGPACNDRIRDWSDRLNLHYGRDVVRWRRDVRSDRNPRCHGGLADLAAAITVGEIDTLVVCGLNPAYAAARDLRYGELHARIPFTVHLGEHWDETAMLSTWHLPEAHFLESWSDLRGAGGIASIQQPVRLPEAESRNAAELLHYLRSGTTAGSETLVRETWRAAGANDEDRWVSWLQRGIVDEPMHGDEFVTPPEDGTAELPPSVGKADGLSALFTPDPNVLDGRWSANAWLQELPKPLTQLAWGNAILLSPALASRLGVQNGDVLRCSTASGELDAPAWTMAGQADNTVALSLGYGRRSAGPLASGLGYDANLARSAESPWHTAVLALRKTGGHALPVCAQGHFQMDGRDLARVLEPAIASPALAPAHRTSLYPPRAGGNPAWGMSIDLSACLGCNACVLACQAENNIPVVGREQVARGREMHWLRIDRYVTGDPAQPRFVAQPVPCMHCENAPCEVVCPVGATVHSSEGLNDMVYNRCIGTRYCSNNCPYKVRRFNFLDYGGDARAAGGANPRVTIRERGVMEKCTYCVQRINAGRIAAEVAGRPLRDGDVRTACQQVCPASAIVFGNLADPASEVSRRAASPTSYALLDELNTRPRTTYRAALRHPPRP
ncbi:MAG TPA: 4Fe-4S dicluster domain-containing protein [Lacunisphaera sp.]|nr:4Fe-4S dicluster domain-containing protein [Lacunisphaera sp.]